VYKVIAFLKRRRGMTREEFITHYESIHAPWGTNYQKGKMGKTGRYFRRYLIPHNHPFGDGSHSNESDYDVVTEHWCDSREQYESTMGQFRAPDLASWALEDELRLFDRSKTRHFVVEQEHESDILE
jgi:hypothetical protein